MTNSKPRYTRSNLVKFRWGPYDSLITILKDKIGLPLPLPLSDLLESCNDFSTLETHAENWWTQLSFRQKRLALKEMISFLRTQNEEIPFNLKLGKGLATQTLKNFAKHKILNTPEDWIKTWGSRPKPEPRAITRLCIPTKNRPDFLERALDSFSKNATEFGDTHDFVIYDDAETESAQQITKELLKKFKDKFKNEIFYAGRIEREAFKKNLAAEGFSPLILDFCLAGDKPFTATYGANRNTFLLDNFGELAISIDDDNVCSLGQSKTSELYSISNPSEHVIFDFFNTRDEALTTAEEFKGSYTQLHAKVLGKSLSELLLDSCDWDDIHFSETGPLLHRYLCEGRGRIMTSFHGLRGDNGSTDPLFILNYSAQNPGQILKDESIFKTALQSREVHRRHLKTHLYTISQCMMGAFGLDLRNILPPFFPLFRNEDLMFGQMAAFIDSESLMAHLPYSIKHMPSGSRNYASIYFQGLNELWPFHIIQEVTRNTRSPGLGTSAEDLLRVLGKNLELIGRSSWGEYVLYARGIYWKSSSDSIQYLEKLLDDYPAHPEFWKKFVVELRDRYRKNLNLNPSLAPPEMVAALGQEKAENKIQEWMLTFGELLQTWPEILKVSQKLKASGKTLSQKI